MKKHKVKKLAALMTAFGLLTGMTSMCADTYPVYAAEEASSEENIMVSDDMESYEVIVENGNGDGYYHAGESVTVTAGETLGGKAFSQWKVTSGSAITISGKENTSATFTMPAENIVVTAEYKAVKQSESGSTQIVYNPPLTHNVIINSGTGDGDYVMGLIVDITAYKDSEGRPFKYWRVEKGGAVLFNEKGESTSFMMPNKDTVITAVYENLPGTAYNVKYAANGGSGVMSDSTAIDGTEFILPECTFVAPAGKEFKAWEIFEKEYAAGTGYFFETDTIINAVWRNKSEDGADNSQAETDETTGYILYEVRDGADGIHMQDFGSHTIIIDAECEKFVNVLIDEKELNAEDYIVLEGSTIITILKDYMNSLSEGEHTIRVNFIDGYAITTVTVIENFDFEVTEPEDEEAEMPSETEETDDEGTTDETEAPVQPEEGSDGTVTEENEPEKDTVPKTGEQPAGLWLYVLAVMSGAGLIITSGKDK